ncbi:MAG: signal peptidase I [Nanoarchaeota archaeon]|nr:signal peptidase I [Nanoarchaeota archaeon]
MVNWKKIWYFIWKDDSLASWLVNVVLAVIIVKFLIFPGLGLLLDTSFPVVAVVSCSMEHGFTNCGQGSVELCGVDETIDAKGLDEYWDICGVWYEDNEIDKNMFSSFPFQDGFNKGDIMVLVGSEDINLGDVIVFGSGRSGPPIIHRVVDIENGEYMTKGDHNSGQLNFEKDIKKDAILGKAVFRVPYLGWVKVAFDNFIGGVLR